VYAAEKMEKNNTWDSNVVPHRSTNQAQRCLTSLSRREAVLSTSTWCSQETFGLKLEVPGLMLAGSLYAYGLTLRTELGRQARQPYAKVHKHLWPPSSTKNMIKNLPGKNLLDLRWDVMTRMSAGTGGS